MAVRFITGVPGAGKSMTAVQTAIRELVSGKRLIITNLALYPGIIWAFIKARYGVEIDISRICILDEDDIKYFYLHRGRGWRAPQPVEKKDGGDGRIDYSKLTGGTAEEYARLVAERAQTELDRASADPARIMVNAKDLPNVLYIIEEAHVHFGSRQWQETAQSALFYLSQHRHLGDEVFFVTQHVEQTDKALRRLTQEFWRMTNYGSAFPFGIKLPDYFVLDVFTSPPGLLSRAIDTRTIKLDIEGLCSCYDTAAGVGMAGGLADTQNKRKGFHWLAAVGVVIAIGIITVLAMSQIPKAAAAAAAPPKPVPPPPVVAPAPVAPAPPAPRPAPALVPIPLNDGKVHPVMTNATQKLVFGPPIEPENGQRLKFFIRKPDSVILGLANGSVFAVGDGRLTIVGKLAILDGNQVYRLPD